MKITKQQLKQIIKEELAKVMDEDMADYVAAASGKDVSGTADQRMKDRKQAILDKYKKLTTLKTKLEDDFDGYFNIFTDPYAAQYYDQSTVDRTKNRLEAVKAEIEKLEKEYPSLKPPAAKPKKKQGGEQSKVAGSPRRLEEDDSSIR